jgi:hypothetical protein
LKALSQLVGGLQSKLASCRKPSVFPHKGVDQLL